MESSYRIEFTEDGARRFRKIDRSVGKKILSKLPMLRKFRELNNIKQMKSKDDVSFRWRIGDFRIIFEVDEKNSTIWITDMGFRGSVYRD